MTSTCLDTRLLFVANPGHPIRASFFARYVCYIFHLFTVERIFFAASELVYVHAPDFSSHSTTL